MIPLVLLILGFLLIFIEFYVPGGVIGLIGGLMVFGSLILFAMESDSPLAIAGYLIAIVVAMIFLVKLALWRIRTAKPSKSIYSDAHQKGFQASHFDHSAIGKKGVVVTDLKPGGYILLEGKQLQALSQSGYLVKGTEVLVVGGEEESLIVKKV